MPFWGLENMAIQVETKDCTALSDSELAEMADMCDGGPYPFEVGLLSKHAESWVLISQARERNKMKGFSFCTLERIGGTPCILIGLAAVKRTSKRGTVLRALMQDQFRRAVLAFPDEDVLVGSRLAEPGAFQAFESLQEIIPRPGHRTTGEERAWGRRLAKRFGVDNGNYDDRSFVARGDTGIPGVLDHGALNEDDLDADVAAYFEVLDPASGDVLIAFGWAMAEDLATLA